MYDLKGRQLTSMQCECCLYFGSSQFNSIRKQAGTLHFFGEVRFFTSFPTTMSSVKKRNLYGSSTEEDTFREKN